MNDALSPVYQLAKQQLWRKAAEFMAKFSPADYRSGTIRRLSAPAGDDDIVNWLQRQPFYPKIYWQDRSGELEIGGAGASLQFTEGDGSDLRQIFNPIQSVLQRSDSGVRFMGGLRFNPLLPSSPEWTDLGSYRLFNPRFEMSRQNGESTFNYHFSIDPDLAVNSSRLNPIADFEKLDSLRPGGERDEFQLEGRSDHPDFRGWMGEVKKALQQIGQGEFQKIVLARQSYFHFRDRVDPFRLLEKLKRHGQNSFCFFIQLTENCAFMSLTPERLYYRQGSDLWSEALAGTRPRGVDEASDVRLEKDLRSSDKERREHRWVREEIRAKLIRLCSEVRRLEGSAVLKLNHVQHLHSQFAGRLRETICDADILRTLHPTSAVGGIPVDKVLTYLAASEGFDRGWYAGPVGWIAADQAEFAVALRSALVRDRTVIAYSGAGIVAGSDPEAEWRETENKLLNFSKLFI